MNSKATISIIGCGWLGLPLGAFLVENGFLVKGSTTRKEKLSHLKENGISPFQIKTGECLEGEGIDLFLQSEILIINIPPGRHRSDVANAHPKEIRKIIEKAEAGIVKKIIFVSSISIYGNFNRIITEDDAPNPSSETGKALVQIEDFLQSDHRFQTTILRIAGLVGGERKAGRFLAGKKNVKNGAAPVNLIHRKDCIRVIYEIVNKEIWNEVFNVCSDEHPTRQEFYVLQAIKQGFEPPQFLKGDKPFFKIISNEKLKNKLGFEFHYPDPNLF